MILVMRNDSDERCRENQRARFMFSNCFPENRAVYEIMWKNMIQPNRPQMTTQYGTEQMGLNAG
jgi:hypothetical protein